MKTRLIVSAVIEKKRDLLFGRKKSDVGPYPNTWHLIGGGVDDGESLTDAIKREIKEEAGIEVEDLKPLDLESKIIESGELYIFTVYTAQAKSESIVLSYEHDKFQWVNLEEFMSLNAPLKLKNAAKKSAG